MKTPRLEIYLDETAGICVAKVDRPNAQSRLIFEIELDDLKTQNPADAAQRLGGTILNLLRVWHKKEFGDWKASVPGAVSEESNESYYIALRLIDRSLAEKSSTYVSSIDALLKKAEEDDEDARIYSQGAWPLLRERIEKF